MQKNYFPIKDKWVQSPLSTKVKKILDNLDFRYIERGSGIATNELELTIKKHRSWVSEIIDLQDFKFAYITSGATEAINHWRLSDTRPWQYFEGEYQYPNLLTKNGTMVKTPNSKDVLYISNPQCHNGNFANFDHIENTVILDCAYVGATCIKKISIPKATEQVMFSFSKGFGLIGQRCGIVYTKKPHPTLHSLKKVECFNYAAAPIMNSIMSNFDVDTMYNLYLEQQQELSINYNFTPTDTFFICLSDDEFYSSLRRKDECARICITPLLKEL